MVSEPMVPDADGRADGAEHRRPVYDPESELFIAQFDRPADLAPVNMRALTPYHRALLVIDGTVTTYLEAYNLEPIDVERLGQARQTLTAANRWLEMDEGQEVLTRRVRLMGRYSRRLHADATSVIALERLPEPVVAALDVEGGGLGRLLNSARSENRREILWYGRERAAGDRPGETGSAEFLVRTYRIIQEGRPIMMISERFPTGGAEQPAHE